MLQKTDKIAKFDFVVTCKLKQFAAVWLQ